jgi:hypothetical protein
VTSEIDETPAAESLAPQFARGAVLLTAANWLTFVLSFVVNLARARPDALVRTRRGLNEALALVGAFALNFALVQTREESRAQYDTATAPPPRSEPRR